MARQYNLRAIHAGTFSDYWYYPAGRVCDYELGQTEVGERRTFDELPPDEKIVSVKRRLAYYVEQKHYLERLIDTNLRERDKFITLTYRDPSMKLERLSDARRDFEKFIKRLRYHTGVHFEYANVWELQVKRGRKHGAAVIHWHFVAFGCPYIKKKTLQAIWGLGNVWIEALSTKDNPAAYVAKYMASEYGMDDAVAELGGRPRRSRAWTVSRGVNRPAEERTRASTQFVQDLVAGATKPPREYRDHEGNPIYAFRVRTAA